MLPHKIKHFFSVLSANSSSSYFHGATQEQTGKEKQQEHQERFLALMSCEKIRVMYILKGMWWIGTLTRMLLFLDSIKKVVMHFLFQAQKPKI